MSSLAACHDCDLLVQVRPLPVAGTARCPRCRGVLRRHRPDSIERTLALALAAAVLFAISNAFPFLAFEMRGQVTQTTLVTGVVDLYQQGKGELSALVGLTIIGAPLLQIALLLYVLLPLHRRRVPPAAIPAFRLLRRVQPWSMMEVFMIGIGVAVVKLIDMAHIVPGLALGSFVLLMLVLAAAVASLDEHAVWERLERQQ